MEATMQEYLQYIRQNKREPLYRISLLRKEDESVYQTITQDVENNTGNITIALTEGSRRACNFVLINNNNQYGDFIRNLSKGDKFKVELGDKIGNKEKYFNQGIFVFSSPSLSSQSSNRKINISGKDKFAVLDGTAGGILDKTTVIYAGTTIGTAIRFLLALPVVKDIKEPMIDSSLENLTLPYDITRKKGDKVSDFMSEVAFSKSAYCYYGVDGRLRVEPFTIDNQKGSIYDFSYTDYNYKGATKKYIYEEIYNTVEIEGTNIQLSIPIYYKAINNDESDPNSVPNLGYEIPKIITEFTEGITTPELAKERGDWELSLINRMKSSIDIDAIVLYHLDVDAITTLTDEYVDSNRERFIINNLNIPIGTDINMSINGTKVL